jgi:hypothetical protein
MLSRWAVGLLGTAAPVSSCRPPDAVHGPAATTTHPPRHVCALCALSAVLLEPRGQRPATRVLCRPSISAQVCHSARTLGEAGHGGGSVVCGVACWRRGYPPVAA